MDFHFRLGFFWITMISDNHGSSHHRVWEFRPETPFPRAIDRCVIELAKRNVGRPTAILSPKLIGTELVFY